MDQKLDQLRNELQQTALCIRDRLDVIEARLSLLDGVMQDLSSKLSSRLSSKR